jgi:hypothetical protein
MAKPCSQDLRERVLEAVMTGASRREAAERFEISASSRTETPILDTRVAAGLAPLASYFRFGSLVGRRDLVSAHGPLRSRSLTAFVSVIGGTPVARTLGRHGRV